MKQKAGSYILSLSKTLLFFAPIAVFYLGQRYYYVDTLFYFWGNVIVVSLYAAFLFLANRIYNGFDFGNAGIQEIVVSWILCLFIANIFQYLILSLLQAMNLVEAKLLDFTGFAVIYAVQILIVIPMAIVIRSIYYYYHQAQNTLIIYGDPNRLYIYKTMIARHRRKFKIVDVVSQYDNTGALLDAINSVNSIFFLDVDDMIQDGLLEYCYLNDKQAYVVPTFSRVLFYTAGTIWLSNSPIFSLKKPEPGAMVFFVKRLIDIIISLSAIIVSGPIMLVVWSLIRLHDGYPAIYKQERVTKNGRVFNMYKFRSMIPNAEDDGVPRLTSKEDDRITPIGRIIRRTRIDELPQLFNVLSGAMSMVGPRPERPEIAQLYEEVYPSFAFRTKVKAGLTGYAQIFGRYNSTPDEKLFLDIMYIETFSILQDIKLILQTINVLFKPASTEGIDGDSTTALR